MSETIRDFDREFEEQQAKQWHSYEPILQKVLEYMRPRRILEWGPGRSTAVMLECSPDATIVSIEHDIKWYIKARQKFIDVAQSLHLHYCPLDTTVPTGSSDYVTRGVVPMQSYKHPSNPYDVIFIDGRLRCDCLALAWLILPPNGVVILHDADRQAYSGAVSRFRRKRIYTDERTAVLSHSNLNWLPETF